MAESILTLAAGKPSRGALKTYLAELPLTTLAVGVDNIHHDVFLSPIFVDQTGPYLLEFIRQTTKIAFLSSPDRKDRVGRKAVRSPEAVAWKRHLSELLHAGLHRAKSEQNIEVDYLLRVALVKYLTQEITTQFANLLLEGKEWIRSRGEHFERGELGHVAKARLAELQGDRRNLFRQAGQHVYQALMEVEESGLARSRRALFGELAAGGAYDILNNRLAFVEGGRDDVLFLEQYVVLGNYVRDPDRPEIFDAVLLELLKESALAGEQWNEMKQARGIHQREMEAALALRGDITRLEQEHGATARRLDRAGGLMARVGMGGDQRALRAAMTEIEGKLRQARAQLESIAPRVEAFRAKADYLAGQYQHQLADYLNEPDNARRLFDPQLAGEAGGDALKLLDEWIARLEQGDLLVHVLASYQLRNICHDYCPPIHLQQLKKALVSREECKRVEDILKQFPARHFSVGRLEELAKKIRRTPRSEVRSMALRFAEDFIRLRRDTRNYERLTSAMERVSLVRNERTRELSRLNHSLYEFVLPREARPAEDRVVSHTVIKADVRGSTKITQDLLARGLNPASLFSLNFYEPVKRILERYGAAKVFIEGDALVLAIFETESNRSQQRAVSRACALARQILAVAAAHNDRAEATELPRLELGVGVAYQGSAPTYWMDTDSRIMISRALNLSDRLSSCSRAAKRLLSGHTSPFRIFLFQTMLEGVDEDEADEFLIRFNLNGVELNEEAFQKLQQEISLASVEADCVMPWGQERVTFYYGETPVGDGVEPVLIRRGFVRQLLPGGRIGPASAHSYYEACTSPQAFEMVDCLLAAAANRRV